MAPKLSPNPGKTARFYRKNKKSRLKHRRDELKRGKSPAKRKYRRDLLKIKPCPKGQDKSHKIVNGKKVVVCEDRKKNRARGGANRK